MFAAAAKCMSSKGGALWDWPPSTPDIDARQLFLTLPFYMPTAPPHLQTERSHDGLMPLFSWTCAITKATTHVSFAAERERQRDRIREIVCLVSARRGVRSSSQHALSLSLFLSVCCVVSWVKK